ncbi:alpha-tocopherol transfer protein-like [Glandiceps talaboti]
MTDSDISSYVCSLTEKTKKKAKDELGEDETTRNKSLVALQQKFNDRPDIKFRSDPTFLLRFLRAKKFDVDRAFKTMVKYYEVRQDYRDIYDNFVPSSAMQVWNDGLPHVLPDRDREGRRILVYRVSRWNLNSYNAMACIRAIIMCMEQLLEDEETQVNGIVFLGDYEGLSMSHLSKLGPGFGKRTIDTMQNAIPVRIKASHYVNEPKLFDTAFALFRPFLNDKLKQRVIFHGDDIGTLHKHIPSDILPSDFGGSKPPCDTTEWVNEMLAAEEAFKQNNEYGLPPKRKSHDALGGSKIKGDASSGLVGSFRKLED